MTEQESSMKNSTILDLIDLEEREIKLREWDCRKTEQPGSAVQIHSSDPSICDMDMVLSEKLSESQKTLNSPYLLER